MTAVDYVTVQKYAELSGYTAKAIRHKIDRKQWREGKQWVKAPDSRILISIKGVSEWVKSTKVSSAEALAPLQLISGTEVNGAERRFVSSPLLEI